MGLQDKLRVTAKYVEEKRGFQAQYLAELAFNAADEIDRLEAALESLPKIGRLVGEGDERRIVRDVVFTAGTIAYWIVPYPEQGEPKIAKGTGEMRYWRNFRTGGPEYCWELTFPVGYGIGALPENCYNSQAAAEFAIEKARKA